MLFLKANIRYHSRYELSYHILSDSLFCNRPIFPHYIPCSSGKRRNSPQVTEVFFVTASLYSLTLKVPDEAHRKVRYFYRM